MLLEGETLEAGKINGTGNRLSNIITGNSSDNILDGVSGADQMIGGGGNDTYYVDNIGDKVIEKSGEGIDSVRSSISTTLSDNVENLRLLDFSYAEPGRVDGKMVRVYGYPKRNELDYMQGDAKDQYQGTCALTSIANILTQAGNCCVGGLGAGSGDHQHAQQPEEWLWQGRNQGYQQGRYPLPTRRLGFGGAANPAQAKWRRDHQDHRL